MKLSVKKAHLEVVEHERGIFHKLMLGSEKTWRAKLLGMDTGRVVKYDDNGRAICGISVEGRDKGDI